MRILAHIHTFNDEDVIDLCLESITRQTYPVDEIVVVDNASKDGTLQRSFPAKVKVIRHRENLGTSGAVVTGMRYALEHQFDWIWIFDADSAPEPDALEKLLAFYGSLPKEKQDKVQILSSVSRKNLLPFYGVTFSPRGCQPVKLDPNVDAYECEAVMWSGSLFKVETVRQIGLPSPDYVLDWGEFEYGYQGMMRGYKTYVLQSSGFDHNIGGKPSVNISTVRLGPLSFKIMELPPIRLYYLIRNDTYFWLYEYHQPTLRMYLRIFVGWIPRHIVKLALLRRWTDCAACLRGLKDGLFKNMHRRY